MDSLNAGLRRKILQATLGTAAGGAANAPTATSGSLLRVIPPVVGADLAVNTGRALRAQRNRSVRSIQNRGGFAASTAKDAIRNTPFIPNAVAGGAAGLGAAAGSLVTGTYPNGTPATGLHRVGAAVDAFGNAYGQTEQQMNTAPPVQQPQAVPQTQASPSVQQAPAIPPDVAAVGTPGLRRAPVLPNGQSVGTFNGKQIRYTPSTAVQPAQPTPSPGLRAFKDLGASNYAELQKEGISPAAYDLSNRLGIPVKEATQLLVQSYQTGAVARAKQVVKGLTPIQAANLKIELAKLGLNAAQVKQTMGLRSQANTRTNIAFRNKLVAGSAANLNNFVNQQVAMNPKFNAAQFRQYVSAIPGGNTPGGLQNALNQMKINNEFTKNAYRGYTPFRLPLTEANQPAQLPAGADLVKSFVGVSGTPLTGSNNLVFKVRGANGQVQKYQEDWNKMSPFMQNYINSGLARLHRLYPKKFPSANWKDYSRVSM